jgi:stage II sporulation protein D
VKRRPDRWWAGLVLVAAGAVAALVAVGCAPRSRLRPLADAPPVVVTPGPAWPGLDQLALPSDEPSLPDAPGPEWPDLESALPPPALRARPPTPVVRIGLAEGVPRATIGCQGAATLCGADGATPLAGVPRRARVELYATPRGVRWQTGGAAGEAEAVLLRPDNPADIVAWGKASYRGALLVRARGGGLTMISVAGLEDYLRGVVPGEIGRLGPQAVAALEAQAIAARTYTIAHLGQFPDYGFDLWGDVRDQLYQGVAGEDPTCDAAVARTANLVLRYGGREIEAYYSSTCGGRTASCEEVWPRSARPYLRSRRDAPSDGAVSFCASSPRFAWEESWSAGELERILQRTLPTYVDDMGVPGRAAWAGTVFSPAAGGADPHRPGRLLDLAVRARTTCGRVALLDVVTAAGVYHVRGDRVRTAMRLSGDRGGLWSALFRLRLDRGRDGSLRRVSAHGRGFGHGVGLCQMGAITMARRGFSAGQILAHYYPGAELAPVGGAPAATPGQSPADGAGAAVNAPDSGRP